MDRTVERLVRQLVSALRRRDEAARIMLWARLDTILRTQPGATAAFGRAIARVDTRVVR